MTDAPAAPETAERPNSVRRRGLLPNAQGGLGERFLQAVPSAVEALRANKGRAILTMLGIIIGVAAVIAIVGLGQIATGQITNELNSLGTNVITVRPGSTSSRGVQGGAGTASTLKEADVRAIRRDVPGVLRLSPVISGSAQVVAGGNNWGTQVQGVWQEYLAIGTWSASQGGLFTESDSTAARSVALLGQTVASKLFPGGQPIVGKTIRIRNVPFVVVGVLDAKGSGGSGPGGDPDDTIMIPFRTAQVRLFGSDSISEISIQANSADRITGMTAQIRTVVRSRHRLLPNEANDFSVGNDQDLLETVGSVTTILVWFLGAVAGISLVVGGIGIMNIMLVSVTERTREIGIRMAIGARPSDILTQFLVESLILAMLGGLIGIGIGLMVTIFGPSLLGYPSIIPTNAILLAFGFSVGIGIVFGVYPARRASLLDPIEALRSQ